MPYPEMVEKMAVFYRGNTCDIDHFLKVYACARNIGLLEGLDSETQEILETAAIVHDIACPLCREKYGNAGGKHQEAESPSLLADFLAPYALPPAIVDRVIHLVSHHHTYGLEDRPDYQILLEADYLANAGEKGLSAAAIAQAEVQIFRTSGGKRLLRALFPAAFS